MKITVRDLIKKKACKEGIHLFKLGNWKNYDFGSKQIVIKNNKKIFDFLKWLGYNFKIPNFRIKYEDSNKFWETYEYDNKGLLIKLSTELFCIPLQSTIGVRYLILL